jgi:hypothetical protein
MTPPDRTTTHGASRFSGSQNPGECARNKPELTAMGTAKTAMEIAPLGAELRHVADADPDVQAPRHDAQDQRAVGPVELYSRAVIGRDAEACIEWLRRYAGWNPED